MYIGAIHPHTCQHYIWSSVFVPTLAHLISGALYSRQSSDDTDPVVQLSYEVTASCLHGRLEVHNLISDV